MSAAEISEAIALENAKALQVPELKCRDEHGVWLELVNPSFKSEE